MVILHITPNGDNNEPIECSFTQDRRTQRSSFLPAISVISSCFSLPSVPSSSISLLVLRRANRTFLQSEGIAIASDLVYSRLAQRSRLIIVIIAAKRRNSFERSPLPSDGLSFLFFFLRQRSRSLKPRLVARRGETPFNYIDEKRLRFAATIPSIILAGRAAINDFRRGSCAPPAQIRATRRGSTGESTER